MYKIFAFIFFVFSFQISALAKEPTLAMLKSVNANEYQKFGIGTYEFICRPYGLITIGELYERADIDSSCKKSIEKFYVQNPLEKYYLENIFKLRQLYHIEFKDNRCIVYVRGKMSVSDLLLREGLGLMKIGFEDKEFKHSFSQAQLYAKENELGLFKNDIMKNCISELYK